MKIKEFELKISGTVTIEAETFKQADILFAKAMKAIGKRWDVDVECGEETTRYIPGRIIKDGDVL
jgi:hypothetical protein